MDIYELCRKLRPAVGPQLDKLWAWYLIGSPREKQEVERILNVLAVKMLNLSYHHQPILLTPPPADEIKGDYVLGNVHYNKRNIVPFGLLEQEMRRHCAIFGVSGAGKTNTHFGLK